MTVQLYYSEKMEYLCNEAGNLIASIPPSAETPLVIIPNPHVKKWLQLRISQKHGICCGCEFATPTKGFFQALLPMLPDMEKRKLLDDNIIEIMILHAILNSSNTTGIQKYLTDGHDTTSGSLQWELAQALGRYFNEYEQTRPEMVEAWLGNRTLKEPAPEKEQSGIYKLIYTKNGIRDSLDPHAKTLLQHLIDADPDTCGEKKHNPLIVFGHSYLNSLQLSALFKCASLYDIYIYQFNPCSEFWEDVLTPFEERWMRIKKIPIISDSSGQALEQNTGENNLLKLWGKPGRETTKLLSELESGLLDEYCFIEHWETHDKTPQTFLENLQFMISRRMNRPQECFFLQQDISLQVMACPSPLREVETVYNSIVVNCMQDPELTLSEIAVLIPDMEIYYPIINTVFDREPKRITWNLSDASSAGSSSYAKGVRDILNIGLCGVNRTTVFNLLDNPCVQRALNIDQDIAEQWWLWIKELGAFHDSDDEKSISGEPGPNYWHHALCRQRMGTVMYYSDDINNTYNNIIPFSSFHTDDPGFADPFNFFIEYLLSFRKKFSKGFDSASEWVTYLKNITEFLLVIPDEMPEERSIKDTFDKTLQKFNILDKPGPGIKPHFHLIKAFCDSILKEISTSKGSFLCSGVNVASLIPKRHLPFKIIYVLGMHEGLFPGEADLSSLNLLRMNRKIGDISRPEADRYIFLETLMSASKKIYYSFVSRDQQKDCDFHPNSTLQQLISFIEASVTGKKFQIINVPARAYDHEYFLDGRTDLSWNDIIQSCSSKGPVPVCSFPEDQIIRQSQNNSTETKIKKDTKSQHHIKEPDYTVKQLSELLIDPAFSFLKYRCGIKGLKEYEPARDEDQPVQTERIIETRLVNKILLKWLLNGGKSGSLQELINEHFKSSSLQGHTALGVFGSIDREILSRRLEARIYGTNSKPGLMDIINEPGIKRYINGIRIGNKDMTDQTELFLPPVLINKNIRLHGAFPVLWEKHDGYTCFPVITAAADFSHTRLMYPFLFYLIYFLLAENNESPGKFRIYVSVDSGLHAWQGEVNRDNARAYLIDLITFFSDTPEPVYMPLSLLTGKNSNTFITDILSTENNEQANSLFRIKFEETVFRDAEQLYSDYRIPDIITLSQPAVPDNILEIARKLYSFPFSIMKEADIK